MDGPVFGGQFGYNWQYTNSGWTIGGGFEWMLAPNWIARSEYLFYSFNNNNNLFAANFPSATAVVLAASPHRPRATTPVWLGWA